MRGALEHVLSGYRDAVLEPVGGHPMAFFVRRDLKQAVQDSLSKEGKGLIVEGSAGAGNWATVPWVSIFDPVVTKGATTGYYVVYLFSASKPVVHLSLNQGTTAVRAEFGGATREVLQDRAGLMRRRLPEFSAKISAKPIYLGSSRVLPADYEAGHALGFTYELGSMPSEEQLQADLQVLVRAYRALTFRGGLDPSAEGGAHEEGSGTEPTSLIETRRYRFHRRIERNSSAARLAKKHHGTRCQCCDFDFNETYGAVGAGYIEAHHLRPISELEEGIAVTYDTAKDFAVLCSNCHRMIHRMEDPSDLNALRALLHTSVSPPSAA
nr:DUF3578 domain-containing protein [Microvirga lupini]